MLRYLNLQVQPETNQLIGANIETFLLETSRLSSRPVLERNFHVFYYLLSPNSNEEVTTLQASAFVSDINAGHTALLGADVGFEGTEDSKNLTTLLSALKFIEFSQSEISFIFAVVAACLHLKELKFYESERTVKVRSGLDSFDLACELLGLTADEFKRTIMNKSIRIMGQTTSVQSLDVASCQASVNSLIAALYSSLFDWMLLRINSALGSAPSAACLNLGILDMAGFEAEKNNGFSQLCNNYGSEKIQFLFFQKSMLEEMELYQSEGLSDVKIDVNHNDSIVQLYEDPSYGLFSIFDAQSRLIGATDDGILKLLLQNLSNSSAPSHISTRSYDVSPKSDSSFIIKHHIGTISYNVNGFIAANKDTHLREDLLEVLRSSSLTLLPKILPNSTGQRLSVTNAGGPIKAPTKQTYISARFRDQMLSLAERLHHCHFIRCFSPNADGLPGEFHGARVLDQLRAAGIFEAVAFKMRSYSFRKKHEQFIAMYGSLMSAKTSMTPKLICRKIISNVFGKGEGIHVGERSVRVTHFSLQFVLYYQIVNARSDLLQALSPQDTRSSPAKSRFRSSADNPMQLSMSQSPMRRPRADSSPACMHLHFAARAGLEIR
jgi:myosin-5